MQLALDSISKKVGPQTWLHDMSLALHSGAVTVLLGATQAGKTSLMRIMAGLDTPTAGRVMVDGVDVTGMPVRDRNVAMVYQQFINYPSMKVAANIASPLKLRGEKNIDARVREIASRLHIDMFLDRYPAELSGGQQQRVALARAIAPAPRMLLLDEPLAALDARIRHRLRDEIRALTDRLGMTALYVTHDQEEALAISDRVVVMREGRIEQAATPATLYLRPASRFVAEFVGQATLIEAEIVQGVPQALGLAWPMAEPCPDGRWLMVLRPEELAADPDGPLRGTVAWVRYLGAVLRVGLVLPCGTGLIADLPSRARRPTPGEALSLRPIAAPALVPR